LRQAKLDFISAASQTQRHPKYWAHLVLIGDSGKIETGGMNMKYVMGAIACLSLLMIFRFLSKKKQSSS